MNYLLQIAFLNKLLQYTTPYLERYILSLPKLILSHCNLQHRLLENNRENVFTCYLFIHKFKFSLCTCRPPEPLFLSLNFVRTNRKMH